MPVNDIEEAKLKVLEWMKGRCIFLRETNSDEVNFQFDGISETQVGVSFVNPQKMPKSIIAVSRLELHPEHQEALNHLTPKEREDFIWDIKKDLIFVPATFLMEPSANELKSIQFAREISFDELTEGRLIDAMDNVCRPLIWTAWVILRKFGPPSEEELIE